jgi:hypothetical protein
MKARTLIIVATVLSLAGALLAKGNLAPLPIIITYGAVGNAYQCATMENSFSEDAQMWVSTELSLDGNETKVVPIRELGTLGVREVNYFRWASGNCLGPLNATVKALIPPGKGLKADAVDLSFHIKNYDAIPWLKSNNVPRDTPAVLYGDPTFGNAQALVAVLAHHTVGWHPAEDDLHGAFSDAWVNVTASPTVDVEIVVKNKTSKKLNFSVTFKVFSDNAVKWREMPPEHRGLTPFVQKLMQ